MKKFSKTIVVLIVAALLLLTACTPTPVEAPSAQDPGQAPADNQAQTPPAAVAEGELVYWSMWNEAEPQGQAIKAAIEDWSAQSGVKVNISWQGRDIRNTLQPALDAGQQIDIFDEDIERVNVTWGSYLTNLEEYAKKDYPTTNGKPYTDVVNKALVDLSRTVNPDKVLSAIPYQPFIFAVFYNKDAFDKAGITSVPKTWAEFLDVCEKLKAAGINPITTDDEYVDALPGYHMARLVGPEEVQRICRDNEWDNPAVLKTVQDWEDVVKKGYVSKYAESNVWPTGQQEIADGSTAMYLNGSWLPNEIKDSTGPDFRWGTFAYPVLEGGKTGSEGANYGSQVFAINKTCKMPDKAFELLVHLTTGKWDSELASMSMGVPMGNDATWPPQLSEAKAVFDNLSVWYPWKGGIQANQDKSPVIVSSFTKLLGGKLSATQFVEELKK